MKKYFPIYFAIIVILICSILAYFAKSGRDPKPNDFSEITSKGDTSRSISVSASKLSKVPPPTYSIPISYHVFQSFNNCGPATLAMAMNYWGLSTNQETLGREIRPNQNTSGINDDKSMMTEEFKTFSQKYGLETVIRPNGDIEKLKKFIANDIPVVVRTWLHPNEDIGHFRIIRGYNENSILQNDSYEGKDIYYDNDTFNSMWEPFNFGYIVVYPKEKQALVEEILGEELDEKVAWQNALSRASQGESAYSHFNKSVANYYLGNYQESVSNFEQADPGLPSRMLWYQIEPIMAYQKVGNSDRVFSLTSEILNNGNGGFSELYQIRGEMYKSVGEVGSAVQEFEKAYLYNPNFTSAKEEAEKLSSS